MLSLSRKVSIYSPSFVTCSRAMSGSKGGKQQQQQFTNTNSRRKKNLDNLWKFADTWQDVVTKKLKFSPEEQAENDRIGKEYGRQCRMLANKFEKDIHDKMWMQSEAVAALPAHLKSHALSREGCVPPPSWRPWPHFDTPPIPGFDINEFYNAKEGASPLDVLGERE